MSWFRVWMKDDRSQELTRAIEVESDTLAQAARCAWLEQGINEELAHVHYAGPIKPDWAKGWVVTTGNDGEDDQETRETQY